MQKTICLLFLIAISTLFSSQVEKGYNFSQSLGASYNPLGAKLTSKFFYRVPLSKKKGMLWESTKIDFGLQNDFSPAFENLSVFANIEPIAFFDLTVRGGGIYHYKALGFGFQQMGSYQDIYSGEARKNVTQENRGGLWGAATPTIKLKVGKVIGVHSFTYNYFNYANEIKYFYEPNYDAVMKGVDYNLLNETTLLYELNLNAMIGFNHYHMFVPGSGYLSQRLCAMGVYQKEISEKKKWYGLLLFGTFLEDSYNENAVFVAFSTGVNIRL